MLLFRWACDRNGATRRWDYRTCCDFVGRTTQNGASQRADYRKCYYFAKRVTKIKPHTERIIENGMISMDV